jgi:hypothetical protein
MSLILQRCHLIAILTLAAIAAGCESKPYGLAPVSGIVTLDGAPVAGAQVSFQPEGGENKNPGPGSTGLCDSSGRYELQTTRKEPGAIPGRHTIRIYGPKAATEGSKDGAAANPVGRELFPPKYNFQTELSLEIPEDGTDAADFKLTSK